MKNYTGKEGGESRRVREKRKVGFPLGDDGKAEEGGHSGDLGSSENKQRASYRDAGINCNPLASQARAPALKTGGLPEDFHSHTGRERKSLQPHADVSLPPPASFCKLYCTELVFPPDLTTVTARKWMLLNIGCCKIVNI